MNELIFDEFKKIFINLSKNISYKDELRKD